ncbi:MAG: MCP four helix bundle domain-containing protein, partial [Pseudomonadota bacterium]|nr:MCP four helix bundle domain-containing protein [Pseudomonadota bacterium]
MTIKSRLSLTFVLLSALFIGIGALALYELRQVQMRGEQIVKNDVATLQKIDSLADVQAKIQTSIRNYMLVDDKDLRKTLKAELAELKKTQEQLIEDANVVAYGSPEDAAAEAGATDAATDAAPAEGEAAAEETAVVEPKDAVMAEFLARYVELKSESERVNKKVMNVLMFGSKDMAATILVNEAAKVDAGMTEILTKVEAEKNAAMD